MGKYLTKNQEEDEKRVVSVRIRTPDFDASRRTTMTAHDFGFSMYPSSVLETTTDN